jgi:hypothetical protein
VYSGNLLIILVGVMGGGLGVYLILMGKKKRKLALAPVKK